MSDTPPPDPEPVPPPPPRSGPTTPPPPPAEPPAPTPPAEAPAPPPPQFAEGSRAPGPDLGALVEPDRDRDTSSGPPTRAASGHTFATRVALIFAWLVVAYGILDASTMVYELITNEERFTVFGESLGLFEWVQYLESSALIVGIGAAAVAGATAAARVAGRSPTGEL